MGELKFLIVDDTPWILSMIADLLRRIPNSHVVECSGRESALANIKKTFFDVCFIDLMLRSFDDQKTVVYEGIPLIEEISRIEKKSVIVAYSSALKENEEVKNNLYEQCRKAGADVVTSRSPLITGSSILHEKINTWIKDKQRITIEGRQIQFTDNLATKAAAETIGERNLTVILEDILPSMNNDLINALDSGFSGAFVLQVHSINRSGMTIKNVLKISNYEFALEKEFRRRPSIGSQLDRSSVSSGTHLSKRVNGWRGILFREIIDAVPLSKYLSVSGISKTVQSTLDKVVSDVFILPAKDAQVIPKDTNPEEEYKFNWKTGFELERSLNSLINMSSVINTHDRKSASIIKEFFIKVIEGKISLITTGRFATLHGDLHSQNIFVHEGSTPLVIDFEKSDTYPRLFDIAAFNVDLLISRLDYGKGAEWKFDRIDIWENWALHSFPFRNGVSDEELLIKGISRIQYIRNGLINAMLNNLDDVNVEEFGRAFLFQIARYLKFPTISVPKKVLAIRLAVRLLKELHLI
jgi:CheY-like chemotaxis protein